MRRLLLSLTVLLLSATPAGAKVKTIRTGSSGVTRLGPWNVAAHPGHGAARRALGAPTSSRGGGTTLCTDTWGPLGLSVTFTTFGGGSGCGSTFAQRARIRGAAGRRNWRTTHGLRIGDSVARADRLYPHSVHRRHARVIVYNRHNPVGTGRLDIITANLADGKVVSFGLWLGGAGD